MSVTSGARYVPAAAILDLVLGTLVFYICSQNTEFWEEKMRRTTRKTGLVDKRPVLEIMARYREAMVVLRQSYAFKTAVYREAGSAIEQADDLALLLTGKRDYFLPRPHATHGCGGEK